MAQPVYIFGTTNELQKRALQTLQGIGVDVLTTKIRTIFLKSGTQDDRGLGFSKMLGNKVMSNLDIEGGSYVNDEGTTVTFPNLIFENVLMTVTSSKNIIKTPIQGKSGTVKEFIGGGDYSIRCWGTIAAENGKYPGKSASGGDGTNTVDALFAALNCNTEIGINSWFLTQFGVYSIVIEDFDIPQQEGGYSTQKFSFTACSDKEFIVNLK